MIIIQKIINNLFIMGFGNFILWTLFIGILHSLVNQLFRNTEKYYKLGVHIHWYDYVLFTITISVYVYGLYIYSKGE